MGFAVRVGAFALGEGARQLQIAFREPLGQAAAFRLTASPNPTNRRTPHPARSAPAIPVTMPPTAAMTMAVVAVAVHMSMSVTMPVSVTTSMTMSVAMAMAMAMTFVPMPMPMTMTMTG